MIKKFRVRNFKGFKDYTVEFRKINILAGSNNSGKTSIFHALQFFFWCLEQIADEDKPTVILSKTQLPEVGAIPYFNLRDLFYKQKIREGRRPARITLDVECERIPPISIDIYPAFSRNIMIDGHDLSISKDQYKLIVQLKPIFIPSTIGIIPHEELYREVAQDRLISEGRHNQVLRNIIFRLFRSKRVWTQYKKLMQPLFKLTDIVVPFDDKKDEWLTALYSEDGCRFDYISAGSGFLQVSNILAFLLLNKSKVALLDEPDAHLHEDLQKVIFTILNNVVSKKNIQLLISTHSPTLIEAAGADSVLVIDRLKNAPLNTHKLNELTAFLAQYGISLSTRSIYDALIDCRVLFVEGIKDDYENFIKIFGDIYDASFRQITRKAVVLATEGVTKEWPLEAIIAFKKMIGTDIKHLLIADRDFKTQERIEKKVSKAKEAGTEAVFLGRRNREAYLLEPKILSRLLKKRFRIKNKKQSIPKDFQEKFIKAYILNKAEELKAETHGKFITENPVYGSHDEKIVQNTTLASYFKTQYDDRLRNGEVPFILMDSKEILCQWRKFIADTYKISFSDFEILNEYHYKDIPEDIKDILKKIMAIFK